MMIRIYFKRLLSTYLLNLILFSVSLAQIEGDRPNILWIVTEDNSKHFLQLYQEDGVLMPAIETLAESGITFQNMISQAPVCSVARSTIIAGCYAHRIGAQYHRRTELVPMPDGLDMFPAYLRKVGYYTTNNAKEDYNIIKGPSVWNESSRTATYRNRAPGQPFFHVQNFGITHEGQLHFTQEQMNENATTTDPTTILPFPYHPNTEIFRYTYAKLHDQHKKADAQIANFLKQLENDGLLEQTIIFYYGDHGGVLPRSKGYIYESGLHVPLVVFIPDKWQHLSPSGPGTKVNGVTSFIDLAPTVLNLAGVEIPQEMDGKPFLGANVELEELESRKTVFSHADRFDEKYDLVRAIRKGDFKYMRNYQSYNIDDLHNFYRYRMLAWKEWRSLYHSDKLNEVQSQFFKRRPVEALFNLRDDPHETNNIAKDSKYAKILDELRKELTDHLKSLPDLSFIPEPEFVKNGIHNPVQYGQSHKIEIAELIDIANLSLHPFSKVAHKIEKALSSENRLKRYWGLIVCSNFGEAAKKCFKRAQELAISDPEPLVRIRALEFLGLTNQIDPREELLNILSQSKDMTQANLILNTIALLEQTKPELDFTIPEEFFDPSWLDKPSSHIFRRLEFINGKDL